MGPKLEPSYTDNAKLRSQKLTAHALVNGAQAYAIWAELTQCNRDIIGIGGVEIGVTAENLIVCGVAAT